jgi:hypothetical protein
MNRFAIFASFGFGALLLSSMATKKPSNSKPSPKKPSPKGPTVTSNYQGELSGLSNNAAERSAELVSLFKQGRAVMPFTILETSKGDLRARLAVSSRAATIDGVRVNLSERGLQQVADALGMHLLTPYLVDQIAKKADLKLTPRPQAWYADGSMGNLARMFDYDAIVNEELGGRQGTLVANEGKDWVLEGYAFTAAGMNKGTNYGWFQPNGKPIQGIGRVHNLDHSDYSQLVRLVSSVVSVSDDGGKTYRNASFEELLTSPKYFPLVSYERLPGARHPGVGGMVV